MTQPTQEMPQTLPETSFSPVVKRLYLLASLSLSDQAAAEQTVREALLYTAQEVPWAQDSTCFFTRTAKKLYQTLKKVEKKTAFLPCAPFSDLSSPSSCAAAEQMSAVLSQLSLQDRFILLCRIQRCSDAELAKIAGVPVWLAKKRLYRLLHQIKNSL